MKVFSNIRDQFKYFINSTVRATASPAPTHYQLGDKTIDLQIRKKRGIPELVKRLELTGKGVEIGVQLGHFSELILSQSSLSRLYSIDPWQVFSKEEYDDGANIAQEEQGTIDKKDDFSEEKGVINNNRKKDNSDYKMM